MNGNSIYKLTACDTDSIKFCKKDGSEITKDEADKLLNRLNTLLPEKIILEHDGYYDQMIVVKSKNYAKRVGNKIEIMGSALKATMKELSLVYFLKEMINILLKNDLDAAEKLYMENVEGIKYLADISQWTSKKTVTQAVLRPKRTTEQRILDALKGKNFQEGDKIRVFFKSDTEVALEEDFDGTYDADRLYAKLFKTVKVLEPVLEMTRFPNFKLKRNKKLLESI